MAKKTARRVAQEICGDHGYTVEVRLHFDRASVESAIRWGRMLGYTHEDDGEWGNMLVDMMAFSAPVQPDYTEVQYECKS